MTERLHFHFSLSCIGEGNGNPLQCSCLENPRDGGAWWAAVPGVAQSWIRLKRLSSSSSNSFIYTVFFFFTEKRKEEKEKARSQILWFRKACGPGSNLLHYLKYLYRMNMEGRKNKTPKSSPGSYKTGRRKPLSHSLLMRTQSWKGLTSVCESTF